MKRQQNAVGDHSDIDQLNLLLNRELQKQSKLELDLDRTRSACDVTFEELSKERAKYDMLISFIEKTTSMSVLELGVIDLDNIDTSKIKSKEMVLKWLQQVREAQEDVRKAQDRVDKAQEDVRKAQDRVRKAQDRVDKAQEDVRKAQEDVRKAQDRVDKAQEDINRPQDGSDLKRARRREELWENNYSSNFLVQSFNQKYLDKENSTRFYNFVKSSSDLWADTDELAYPYFPLIQSSGYGKSRLLSTLTSYNDVIYVGICLRQDDHGHPPATQVAKHFFQSLRERVSIKGALRDSSLATDDFFKEEIEELTQWIFDLVYETLPEEYQKNDKQQNRSRRDCIRDACGCVESRERKYVVFAIDEARFIFGSETPNEYSFMFRILRHALLAFKFIPFVCILTDTTSGISNYLQPVSKYTVSSRELATKRYIVPYVQLYTMDVMQFMNATNEDVKPFWRLGRPLWYGTRKGRSLESMWSFVSDKLFCGRTVFESQVKGLEINVDLMRSQIAAIIGVLTGVRFQNRREMGSKVVRSHMATLLGIHSNRELREVMYVPEPMLAEVALRVFSKRNVVILECLDDLFLSEFVLEGLRGEFVVCLLLLYLRGRTKSFDSATESIEPLSVKEWFLKISDTENNNIFIGYEGYLNYTSFHTLDRSSGVFQSDAQLVLKWAYDHAIGFMLPQNWKAADIMIPVMINNSKTGASSFSCILIQVKNRKSKMPAWTFQLKDVFSMKSVDASWCKLKSVKCITMQMRIEKEKDDYKNLCFYNITSSITNNDPNLCPLFHELLKPWKAARNRDMKRARFGYLNRHYDPKLNSIVNRC